ncbi:type II secretion system protein [bacterium]|nr:type II secretion system protein [bacterium]
MNNNQPMIQKMRSQNKKYKAFTLIEMLIVLIVM